MDFIAIDRRGTSRTAVCIGPWAIKIARSGEGRSCNRAEAARWMNASDGRRPILCPVLFAVPGGLAIVMQRATPISESEANHLRETRGFPDWDYLPGDEEGPFEPKASDWGRLPDGRLVALDYATPNDTVR